MTSASHEPAALDPLAHSRATLTMEVADLARSIHWYTTVFGCEPVLKGVDTSLTGQSTSFAAFHLAGLNVFLSASRSAEPGEHSQHPPRLVFMTRQPLVPLRRELQRRGAMFDDDEPIDGFDVDADGVRVGRHTEFLWFYDPDGNRMEFCRALAAESPRSQARPREM